MPETTPLIKAALNLRVGAGFDVYEDSSEMICRLKNFLYEGKYIDKRKNVEIEFFNSAQSMIEKLNSKNILQN